jgi:hypothetical protein
VFPLLGRWLQSRQRNILIGLSPIAALVHKVIAIAGVDNGNLERVPVEGDVSLAIERGADSYVEVPQLH